MRINRQIRVPKVRVIGKDGEQLGILNIAEALAAAEQESLDLVEISPNSTPVVCKIVDYGKYRYEITKKEKESKKSQHQVKVKEIKIKPNTDEGDLEYKAKHAREFLEKGHKVRLICTFRGREMQHTQIGHDNLQRFCEKLADIAQMEAPPRQLGKNLSVILQPARKK